MQEMEEILVDFASHCAFKTLCLIKLCGQLKVAEENFQNSMKNVFKFHSRYVEYFSYTSVDVLETLKTYLSVILFTMQKLTILQDGVIIGEPDRTHECSIHRTLLGSFNQPQRKSTNLLSFKSVAGFRFSKKKTETEIRQQAAELVKTIMKMEVSFTVDISFFFVDYVSLDYQFRSTHGTKCC
jgi:hypothetical protein